MEKWLNQIIHGDCLEVMKQMPDKCVDLIVTSPPYDDLRVYNGYSFDFEGIARELYRILKDGGVVVWVVGDATIKGSETGTSFRQALYFKEIGFNLHDTMIYQKNCYSFPPRNRYFGVFEYMFIFSKGKLKTYNLATVKTIQNRKNNNNGTSRDTSGSMIKIRGETGFGTRIKDNVWKYEVGYLKSSKDKIAYQHPAIFPEKLAEDHIISWSNEGGIVLDPFAGSGTTLKMARDNNRNFIGIEISNQYVAICHERLAGTTNPLF